MFARKGRLAAAAGAVLFASAFVNGDQTTISQEERVAELQARLASLEARQQSADADVANVVQAILRDADQRSQLLAASGDGSAGYDNGFFIRSGDWVMRPAVQFQFRHVTNYREDTVDGDEWENGFEGRRIRFEIGGTAFVRNFTYFFQWDTTREGGSLNLLEAWARYMFTPDWGTRFGQFKDQVTHEFIMSSKRGLAADTSMMDALLGGGITNYIQGATLIYGGYGKDNPLNIEAGFHDGANQINTDCTGRHDDGVIVTGAPPAHAFDFGLAGRAEYKCFGEWGSYADFTAKGTKQDMLVLGTGGDWSQSGDGDQLIGAVDAQYELTQGVSLYSAGIVRHLNSELSGRATDTTDWGLLGQAAYAFLPQWEVFARYDVTFLDQTAVFPGGDTEDVFHEITVGLNYYLGTNGSALHRGKITLDLTYLPDGAPRTLTSIGSPAGGEGENEFILRGQIQLVI